MKGGGASKRKIDDGEENFRAVKRERLNENDEEEEEHESTQQEQEQDPASRRMIRSQFLQLKSLINEKRDDLMNTDSDKFDSILNEFKKLHDQVQKPREQVADAEALLDLTRTLVGSVKSLLNEGITPAQFVGCLLKDYGQEGTENSINWKKLGMAVSPIFMNVHGCCTMLGPMENELKQRKIGVQRKRTKATAEKARPEELDESNEVEKADTDQNMITMFNVMKKNTKGVPLESLILNRTSFAQTVENLFTLSFLVKEGRAEIRVDENCSHYVEPKNAPKTQETYTHFVFRYDYQDWKVRTDPDVDKQGLQSASCKFNPILDFQGECNHFRTIMSLLLKKEKRLMKDMVPEGKELMPHRSQFCTVVDSQPEMDGDNSQPALSLTPIRKLSRNRGRIVQEEGVVEESPQCDEENVSKAAAIRRCKRKLH